MELFSTKNKKKNTGESFQAKRVKKKKKKKKKKI